MKPKLCAAAKQLREQFDASAIVTVPQTAGSVIVGTQLVSLTIIQMSRAGFVPSMLIAIYPANPSQTSCPIWLINFVSWQSLISASRTSSSMARSPQVKALGAGELILGLTSITIIAISRLLQKVMKMARSLMFRS
jgi:hypothetical protein